VVARIISPNQYGFVQRRQIQDCIGIASEAINMLSKKVIGGNATYKVDIHKVFDTLSWKFLLLVLTRFCYHPSFIGWISTIMTTWWVFFLAVQVSDNVILCLLYFCVLQRKFLVELSLDLNCCKRANNV